jgi:DNA modification methylase
VSVQILHGDCLEVLRTLPDCSVDAVVTDPPYGLSFMGKRWDYDVPATEVWAECLRVLKPGGHLLAFAGTRTQHRMAVRIEDAGFEIRDMIAWVYGSGFPKSLDVSKALDKSNAEAGRLHKFTEWMRSTGVTAKQINAATGTFMASHYLTAGSQPAIPTPDLWAIIRPMCGDVPAWVDELVARISAEREVASQQRGTMLAVAPGQDNDRSATTLDVTAPATAAARQWAGWGTALKSALEPITFARKPLAGTVAENVLRHGTGGLNIDGCRIPGEKPQVTQGVNSNASSFNVAKERRISGDPNEGRWPANLIHDGSEEVVEVFGEPARFFYCAKASKRDRGEGNVHPTVKPTDLMRYLCRLVTPPGGVVLDPFMGSGSTGKAAVLEGFRFVGIEREAEYVEIARARIEAAQPKPEPAPEKPKVAQLDMFEAVTDG